MRYLTLIIFIFFLFSAHAQDAPKTDTSAKIFTYAEQMPDPGFDINKYLREHLNYPDSAFKNNIQGRVVLKFIVNEDGSISDVKVEKGIGGGCDEEAVKVLSAMPKWKPGMNNGVPVKVSTMLPVSFILTEPEMIYTYVEQMPVPKCGFNNINEYIARDIRYPDSAVRNNIQGPVFVKFVVNEDGSVSNYKVERGIGGGCDEEAIRVVRGITSWTPGKQDGKPVKVYFALSVQFDLKSGSIVNVSKKGDTSSVCKDRLPYPNFDMEAYLRKKLHYPSAAKDSNIHGKVIVGFIVHEDGNISDPIIVKGIGGGCDEEALRLIKDMPFWAPCTQDGKPIKVFFTQPIWFRLAKG